MIACYADPELIWFSLGYWEGLFGLYSDGFNFWKVRFLSPVPISSFNSWATNHPIIVDIFLHYLKNEVIACIIFAKIMLYCILR